MALTASELAIVSRLLDEALPLDANARAQWLGALPAEHERLAPVLSRLLLEESAARSGGLLGRPPPLEGRDAQELLSPVSGERVGPYRLIRELGRGGMGAVWLADRADGAYTRRVAVKLPRLSWAPELAGRIRRERDLLAALEHPNIARLYDAGVDALGRPYLALEYVEGRAIDRFCRESDLSVRERLHLFLEVARAVTYAHARLIVHRDLKPSNILVGADRTVHLLDFGIGKLLESETTRPTQLTELGGHALTPDYASPEQLRGGPITVGSDVYSLGVLLYELLTGERPFAPASASGPGQTHPSEGADAPLASHRTSDPSTKRILRGDLDTILAKALKRDPVDRYASVEAFAADLQRFLDGNAVLARPDSAGYRVAKFARRHWWGVAATGAVLTTLIAGAAVSLWEAEQAAKEAERARLVKDYIVDMFRLSARAETRAAEAPAHAAELLLERGARQIETRFARQPALQAELLGAVGNIFLGLGQSRQATEMATKQLTLLERVAAPPLQRALALRTLARAQIQEQRLDEAAATLRTALRGLGGESVADEAELRALLAWCLILRWQVDQARAELDTADASLKGAGIADSRAEGEIAFARAYLLLAEERFAEARPLFERATRLFDQIEGELSARAIEVRDLYARALLGNSQIDDGRGIYEHLIAALRNAFGPLNLQAAELELEMTRWIMLRGLMRQEHEGIRRLENVKRVLEQQGERVPRQLAARADLTLAWAYATDGQIMRGDRLVANPPTTSRNPSRASVPGTTPGCSTPNGCCSGDGIARRSPCTTATSKLSAARRVPSTPTLCFCIPLRPAMRSFPASSPSGSNA